MRTKRREGKELLIQNSRFNLSIYKPDPESLHSSPLPLSLSKTTLALMEIGEWYGMEVGYAQSVQIHPNKGKNKKNAQENEEARRKQKNPKRHRTRTTVCGRGMAVRLPPRAVVGPTVSPWWALSLPVCLLLQRCVLCSFGASIWAAGFAYVRSFWASFVSFFDSHRPSTSYSNYM